MENKCKGLVSFNRGGGRVRFMRDAKNGKLNYLELWLDLLERPHWKCCRLHKMWQPCMSALIRYTIIFTEILSSTHLDLLPNLQKMRNGTNKFENLMLKYVNIMSWGPTIWLLHLSSDLREYTTKLTCYTTEWQVHGRRSAFCSKSLCIAW